MHNSSTAIALPSCYTTLLYRLLDLVWGGSHKKLVGYPYKKNRVNILSYSVITYF